MNTRGTIFRPCAGRSSVLAVEIPIRCSSQRSCTHARATLAGTEPPSSMNNGGNARSLANSLKPTVFSAKRYVHDFLEGPMLQTFPDARFVEARLNAKTVQLAEGSDAVVVFVNDDCSAPVVEGLARAGVKLVALRCAGYDRVDVQACEEHGIKVVRVPTYSPQSVAEHAVALMFGLNRSLHHAHLRVAQGNYTLDGLVGSEMFQKTVGVIGTGAIGVQACRILKGIGCNVVAHDIKPSQAVLDMGIAYHAFEDLLPQCDVITLHCPLLPSTRHIINRERILAMKQGTMLINVSRGGLIDSDALFEGLEAGNIGALGMDVYEGESSLFFEDFSSMSKNEVMKFWDRRFRLLLSYPQVLVTPHSAFLTKEALKNIADTTLSNLTDFALGRPLANQIKPQP